MTSTLALNILRTLTVIGNAQGPQSRTAPVDLCDKDGQALRDSPCSRAPTQAVNDVSDDNLKTAKPRKAQGRTQAASA